MCVCCVPLSLSLSEQESCSQEQSSPREVGGKGALAAAEGSPPRLGDKSRDSAKEFERLWQEEVDAVGQERASLARVMTRVWTARSMVRLTVILSLQGALAQVCSVLLVERSLGYYRRLQRRLEEDPRDPPDLTAPLLLAIAAFSHYIIQTLD